MHKVRCAKQGAQVQTCFIYHSHANTSLNVRCPTKPSAPPIVGDTKGQWRQSPKKHRCARKNSISKIHRKTNQKGLSQSSCASYRVTGARPKPTSTMPICIPRAATRSAWARSWPPYQSPYRLPQLPTRAPRRQHKAPTCSHMLLPMSFERYSLKLLCIL